MRMTALMRRWTRFVDGVAEVDDAGEGILRVHIGAFPELGFPVAQASEHPLAVDEHVEHGAAFGRGGVEAGFVFGEEGLKFGRVFVREDFGLGVNAGFEGIEAGNGFARKSAGACGLLSVEAVGLLLFE